MIIPGFALQRARTVASCASASVKSHFLSNKATLLIFKYSRCVLVWGVRSELIATIFLSMARGTRRGTDVVGWDSSAIRLKNPSGTQKDSLTCSLDSTLFLGTSPRVAICLSGRSHQSLEAGLLVHAFQLPCTFRSTGSRPLQWEPCSRRHPRSSPGPVREHRTRPG